MRTKNNIAWGSHIPVLLKLLSVTDGPILEMGGGLYSTPFLHWACFDKKRELVTCENIPEFYDMEKRYESDFHKVIFVENYDDAPIERPWSIAFIDQWPAIRRKEDIKRLADLAQYLVAHDTEKRQNYEYRYDEIYPLFKYNFKYRKIKPHTSVLSNFNKFEI
ncbi:MAG: hypothetical protein AAB837_02850 [Patescibacteria group bacterium]